ncbi:OmpA family protein [Horticoccus luteus]|uniref:OmpA family protein n=1 Tax=Horticoccus luteus TaxID=2862869 RepID=A0A8F9TWV5_9BACT|nr:OmpA family protein [Horticoccus luteus]QYM80595.1 OmpA family protein [Horticoccus luteus]
MNIASKKLILVIAGLAVGLAGCAKKPKRPDPSSTVLGQSAGGSINPMDVATTSDVGSQLEAREPGFDLKGQLRGKLESVYFSLDKSAIAPAERPKLQAAADYLKDHPDQRLLLEGHCDWRGTAEYNLGLGDRRAAAARKYLVTLGVDEKRLETLSKGSEDAAKNADEGTMAKDRRVELVILQK